VYLDLFSISQLIINSPLSSSNSYSSKHLSSPGKTNTDFNYDYRVNDEYFWEPPNFASRGIEFYKKNLSFFSFVLLFFFIIYFKKMENRIKMLMKPI
jgi:hypothetical protein